MHLGDLDVHFGYQRAGGVEYVQIALCGVTTNRLRHPVRAEYHCRAFRYLGKILHEHRPLDAKRRLKNAT